VVITQSYHFEDRAPTSDQGEIEGSAKKRRLGQSEDKAEDKIDE